MPRLCGAAVMALTGVLAVGCTASRSPLAVIEPEYSFVRDVSPTEPWSAEVDAAGVVAGTDHADEFVPEAMPREAWQLVQINSRTTAE